MGPNERRVREAIEWCATGYGDRWVLSWRVARVAGTTRRTARYWLERLEREGLVEQRPTTWRVADDRHADGAEWRFIEVVAAAE